MEKELLIEARLSNVPGYLAWFNMKYKEDPAIYVYKLMDDLASNDLEVLEGTHREMILHACDKQLSYL